VIALPDIARKLRDAMQDDRVVPPTGFTARLVLFVSGAMACLAVFAVAFALSADGLADRWGAELAHSSTIHITAPVEDRAAQVDLVLRILESTPGVTYARPLDDGEQRALLEPWLGSDFDWEILPLPQVIEVLQEDEGFDAAGLRLRLAAEVPTAVFEDHAQWRGPLVAAASRLGTLATLCVLLLVTALAAMVTLAAHAALAANVQVISVLRLVGATDRYIAGAFVRRFTLRAATGAALGVALGLIALTLLADTVDVANFPGLGFRGAGWILPLLIPVFAGGVALVATGWSARRVMKGLD
jgi:cell division transport system permease protein